MDERPLFMSGVPAFKKALKARLENNPEILADAAANGGDLEVVLGNPHPLNAPKTIIVIGAMSNHSYDYTCGMTQANELYDILLVVSLVDYVANDKTALIDRAYGLADMITRDMLTWNIGSTILDGYGTEVANAVIPDIEADQEFTADDAREFMVELKLHVVGRVS